MRWRVFLGEIIWPITTFVLAIWLAQRFLKIFKVLDLKKPEISLVNFLIYFLIITALVLLFLRFAKRNAPFQIFFIFALFIGIQTVFGAVLSGVLPTILAVIFVLIRIFSPIVFVHNLTVMVAIAGASAVLGLGISPLAAVVLLAILSVYDIVAVYKTKHMVKMAKEMAQRGALFAFIIPEKISDMGVRIKAVIPGEKNFLMLGGGDVALPLLLVVSVAPQGIKQSLIVAAFTFLGFLFTHILFSSQKIRRPMPALPPIALAAILGYIITLI